MTLDDIPSEYSERSDDELLHVASERHYLTTEARAALDAELHRRNLTEADQREHQRFVKRQEQRESRKHRRKQLNGFKYQMTWRDILGALAAMALIAFAYFALPARYRMKPDWEYAAACVVVASVVIVAASDSRRKFTFWISLAISSATHLLIVHAWARRAGGLSRGGLKSAGLLGFVLFLAVYGLVRLLQRAFHNQNKEAQTVPNEYRSRSFR